MCGSKKILGSILFAWHNKRARVLQLLLIICLCVASAFYISKKNMDKRNYKLSLDDNKLLEVNIEGRMFKSIIDEETGVLKVLKEPEDDEILRFKSVKINEDDLSLVVKFMINKLLPTMYNQGGIGIAAIQVGVPIKAFIVDIPISKVLIDGKYKNLEDPRYLRKKLEVGEVVVIKELTPTFIGVKMVYESKFTKKIPKIIEKNGQKKFVGIMDEKLTNYSSLPEIIVEHKPYFFLNPKIDYNSDEQIILPEGCLSVPMEHVLKKYNGIVNVKRPVDIQIKYINEKLEEKKLDIKGFSSEYWKWFSRCAQHEYDHTEGILFIDELELSNSITNVK